MRKTKFLSLILSAVMLTVQPAYAEDENFEYDLFERLSGYASNLYIDETVTTEQIMEDALKAVVKDNPELANKLIKAGFQSLDEYSEYYTQEEFELFNRNLNHIVYGIGVIIQQIGDYITVMSCTKGGGAEAAGVISGDRISKVDGIDVKGYSVDKVQDLVVGEIGTEVTVTFLRNGQEIERTITRQEVKGTTVSSEILAGKIGYISILNFAESTADEFYEVLKQFRFAGIYNVILDLRDNPGGYLEAAVDIAKVTVPSGVIVSTVFRNEWENEIIYSNLKETKFKFAVLVNENTASAAEVLASAMGESGVGLVIGEQTYGKGVIQQMFQMWDGTAFKITTGKYFTRNGKDIHGNGIEPDEYVSNQIRRIDVTKFTGFDYKTEQICGDISENVRAAKERLYLLGYYIAAIDNNFDETFVSAVKAFQEENNIPPTGNLDVITKVKIENTFYMLEEVIDNQMIYAYEYFGGNPADIGL